MLKKILWIVLALILIGGAFVYYQWNKPHKTAEGKADAMLSVDDLVAQFVADETKAFQAYKELNIQVTGLVHEAGPAEIVLVNSAGDGYVRCALLNAGDAAGIEAGQNIAMKGLCSGYDNLIDSEVQLTKSVPVKQ